MKVALADRLDDSFSSSTSPPTLVVTLYCILRYLFASLLINLHRSDLRAEAAEREIARLEEGGKGKGNRNMESDNPQSRAVRLEFLSCVLSIPGRAR